MSPIELLKSGIQEADWGQIGQAYQSLTGQTIDLPQPDAIPKQRFELVMARIEASLRAVLCPSGAVAIVPPTDDETRKICMDQQTPVHAAVTNGESADSYEDRITKDDIDGDGPDEPLKEAGRSTSKNVFGDPMTFVSRAHVDPREVAVNQRKAKVAASRKKTRPEPIMHEVECSKCGKTIESTQRLTNGIGQTCGRCIRKLAKD